MIEQKEFWEVERLAKYQQDKRRVGWFHWGVLFVGIVLIVYSQSHDQVAVEVPVYDGEAIRKVREENDRLKHMLTDYKALTAHLKLQVQTQNIEVAKLTDQLKALSVSVPPQPVILQAIQKEAATEAGFRKLVARNFGEGIAKRVKVVE